MKALFLLIGESFRSGGRGSRVRGHLESYKEQIEACNSHISFFDYIVKKFNLEISVIISTYNTQFNNDLNKIYNKYLIKINIFSNPIGLINLFLKSVPSDLKDYQFIFYFRIDIYLKKDFFDIFNKDWNRILHLCVCWESGSRTLHGHPRVNDMMLFIPKNYFKIIRQIKIGHDLWEYLVINNIVEYNDLDMMVNTYHDTNTIKDYNPYYYIVNRSRNLKWHTPNLVFNKDNFNIEKISNITKNISIIDVLSIDHKNGDNDKGKFFHFNFDNIIPLTINQIIINSRTLRIDNIIIWNTSNGGSIGKFHGRYKSQNTNNDFRVNDRLYRINYNIKDFSKLKNGFIVKVLSVKHKESEKSNGKYFNFNNTIFLKVTNLGYLFNTRTLRFDEYIIWNYNKSGSLGNAHGRYKNKNKDNDFKENDILFIY